MTRAFLAAALAAVLMAGGNVATANDDGPDPSVCVNVCDYTCVDRDEYDRVQVGMTKKHVAWLFDSPGTLSFKGTTYLNMTYRSEFSPRVSVVYTWYDGHWRVSSKAQR